MQGAIATAPIWADIITTTLNQLLVASGVGAGTTLVGVLYQVIRALGAWRAQIEGATTNQSTNATTSLIDQVVQQGIAMIVGRMQVKAKGAATTVPTFKSGDVNEAVHFVRDTLQAHGLVLDSDVIRGKVHAVLGAALLGMQKAAAPTNPPAAAPGAQP